ncbi:hypothetical protein CU098_005026, partial [Rhizopus stolonifer]
MSEQDIVPRNGNIEKKCASNVAKVTLEGKCILDQIIKIAKLDNDNAKELQVLNLQFYGLKDAIISIRFEKREMEFVSEKIIVSRKAFFLPFQDQDMIAKMVLPLKNNFGSLPPDKGSNTNPNSSQSSTDYSTQPSQNISGVSIQPAFTSYAHVTSAPPVRKISSRNSANLRTEASLFRSFDSDNQTLSSPSVIHRTGTTDNSIFYHIPHHLKHMRVAFSIALSDKFPFGIGLGLTTQGDSKGTIVEVTLASKEACEEAITTPLSVEDQNFSAFPAVHPNRALMKVNLSKIPIMPIDKLKTKLLNNFARYGLVHELVIFFDDWGQRWFSGNGCVYLERPANSEIQFEKLTYKIPLDDDHSCL